MGEIFRVKAIKPRKLRIDDVRLELLNAMRASGKKDRELAEQTTENWKRVPRWETDISLTNTDAAIMTYIDDPEAMKIWNYLNDGTPAHPITPVRAKYLVFNSTYKAGSKPNQLRTSRSISSGPLRRARAVWHPGIKPRNWQTMIYTKRFKSFKEEMNTAVKTGLRNGGWD